MGFHHSKPYQSPEEYRLVLEDYKHFISKYCKIGAGNYMSMTKFMAAFATYLEKTEKYKDADYSATCFIYGDPHSENAEHNAVAMIKTIKNVDLHLSCGYYNRSINLDKRYIIGMSLIKFPQESIKNM
jgi:hypothetical protein